MLGVLREDEVLADGVEALTTSEQQWFTLLLIVAITTAILIADWSIWSTLGVQATFSHAFDALYRRWPITSAVFFLWIGVLVGHLIPATVTHPIPSVETPQFIITPIPEHSPPLVAPLSPVTIIPSNH